MCSGWQQCGGGDGGGGDDGAMPDARSLRHLMSLQNLPYHSLPVTFLRRNYFIHGTFFSFFFIKEDFAVFAILFLYVEDDTAFLPLSPSF